MNKISADTVWQTFELVGADVRVAQFCDATAARSWFDRLYAEIPWEHHRLRLFGRQIEAPRLSCWIGDADAAYTYSGTRFVPHAWTAACTELRERLRELCGEPFNSALANLYRDGSDSMGWHSDKEPELGARPCIASLSFGASRRFRLRHRRDPVQRLELELASGSLLLMSGATQRNYRHDLPKAAGVTAPRLNLTFRHVHAIVPVREGHKAAIHGRADAGAIVPDREDHKAALRGRTDADAIVPDREDQKAAIHGRTDAGAIVPDREDQNAAIRGRTDADAIVPDREDQKAALHGRTLQKSNDHTKSR